MIKKLVWILVILFLGWAFVSWLLSGNADLEGLAGGAGDLLREMKDALGIFFNNLGKE
jgi:hypothetical protein